MFKLANLLFAIMLDGNTFNTPCFSSKFSKALLCRCSQAILHFTYSLNSGIFNVPIFTYLGIRKVANPPRQTKKECYNISSKSPAGNIYLPQANSKAYLSLPNNSEQQITRIFNCYLHGSCMTFLIHSASLINFFMFSETVKCAG